MAFNSSPVAAGDEGLATQYNDARDDIVFNAGDFEDTTGSANTYEVTVDEAIETYVDGMILKVRINASCTGPSTIDANGIGAVDIVKTDGSSTDIDDLLAATCYVLIYNATAGDFQLVNSPGGGADFNSLQTAGEDLTAGNAASIGSRSVLVNLASPDSGYPVSGGTAAVENEQAQSFTVAANSLVIGLRTKGYIENAPTDNMVCRIETNNAGVPSGTLVDAAATASIPASDFPPGSGEIKTPTFFFTKGIPLVTGTTYWAVFKRSGAGDATNRYRVHGKSSGGGAGNRAEKYNNAWSAEVTTDLQYLELIVAHTYKLDTDASTPAMQPLGIATASPTTGTTGIIQTGGAVSNQSNLIAGRMYYASTTGGAIALKGGMPVGRALSDVKLLVDSFGEFHSWFNVGHLVFNASSSTLTTPTIIAPDQILMYKVEFSFRNVSGGTIDMGLQINGDTASVYTAYQEDATTIVVTPVTTTYWKMLDDLANNACAVGELIIGNQPGTNNVVPIRALIAETAASAKLGRHGFYTPNAPATRTGFLDNFSIATTGNITGEFKFYALQK